MASATKSSSANADVDPKELKRLVLRCVDDFSGSTAVQLIYIGDKLGLFTQLSEAGRKGCNAAELASASGCHATYCRIWLEACVAHSFVECCEDVRDAGAHRTENASTIDSQADLMAAPTSRRYYLTGAQREVLANEGGQHFQCGTAQLLAASAQATPAIIRDGFRNLDGGGVSWEQMGFDAREGIARMNAATHRDLLPRWVDAICESRRVLGSGSASVLDVGCGHGESTLRLAAAFPACNFLGIDPDAESVAEANRQQQRRGVANVRFLQVTLEDLCHDGAPTFELVISYDCIHDIPDPVAALGMVRRIIARSGGVFLWFEPHGSDDPVENREILGARLVAGIALNCVTTSMASGGRGVGAHGCTPARAEMVAKSVGFTSFRRERELVGASFRNNVYVLGAEGGPGSRL